MPAVKDTVCGGASKIAFQLKYPNGQPMTDAEHYCTRQYRHICRYLCLRFFRYCTGVTWYLFLNSVKK